MACFHLVSKHWLWGSCYTATNLGERDGVEAVLGSDLEADSVSGLGVPGSLGTGLGLAVDLVVVGGSEGAQVVGGSDGGGVAETGVAESGAVAGEGTLLDVKAGRGTSEETLMADNGIDVGNGALEQVEEGAAVEDVLLEVQVELGALGLVARQEAEDTLSLEALGDAVSQLNLGLQGVGSVPGLGDGKACDKSAGHG